jgi:hypothetical protein
MDLPADELDLDADRPRRGLDALDHRPRLGAGELWEREEQETGDDETGELGHEKHLSSERERGSSNRRKASMAARIGP